MKISITLSANAGVAIEIGTHRIWVDALHDSKAEGFSTLTPELQKKMLSCEAFFHPEWICYTHCHPDHYSEKLTKRAKKLWPEAWVMVPDETWNQSHFVIADDLTLRFFRLPHEGAQYADVKHFGLIVSCQGINILIPGDCAVGSEVLTEAISHMTIHAALLDFPWATLRRGREYLLEHFSKSKIILHHLPFVQDDTNGYRQAACFARDQLRGSLNVRLLMDPLQTIEMEL